MQGRNLPRDHYAETGLLLKLRFACLLSRHHNLMLDPKVVNHAVNLLKYLQKHGPSQQFKVRYIHNVGNKPALLGGDFELTVGKDLRSIDIHRCSEAVLCQS